MTNERDLIKHLDLNDSIISIRGEWLIIKIKLNGLLKKLDSTTLTNILSSLTNAKEINSSKRSRSPQPQAKKTVSHFRKDDKGSKKKVYGPRKLHPLQSPEKQRVLSKVLFGDSALKKDSTATVSSVPSTENDKEPLKEKERERNETSKEKERERNEASKEKGDAESSKKNNGAAENGNSTQTTDKPKKVIEPPRYKIVPLPFTPIEVLPPEKPKKKPAVKIVTDEETEEKKRKRSHHEKKERQVEERDSDEEERMKKRKKRASEIERSNNSRKDSSSSRKSSHQKDDKGKPTTNGIDKRPSSEERQEREERKSKNKKKERRGSKDTNENKIAKNPLPEDKEAANKEDCKPEGSNIEAENDTNSNSSAENENNSENKTESFSNSKKESGERSTTPNRISYKTFLSKIEIEQLTVKYLTPERRHPTIKISDIFSSAEAVKELPLEDQAIVNTYLGVDCSNTSPVECSDTEHPEEFSNVKDLDELEDLNAEELDEALNENLEKGLNNGYLGEGPDAEEILECSNYEAFEGF